MFWAMAAVTCWLLSPLGRCGNLESPHLLFSGYSVLQAGNRACLSADEGRFLPTLLRDDLRASRPVTVLEPFYCRPFACEVDVLQSQFPVLAPLPCKPAVIKSVMKDAMIRDWQSSLRVKSKAKKLKPSPDLPLYLHVDTQPARTIRARLRFGVALTPQRRHLYRKSETPNCPHCVGKVGTTTHVLLDCHRYRPQRIIAEDSLRALLPVPIQLTLDLLLGVAPRRWPISAHVVGLEYMKAVAITGSYLQAINKIDFLLSPLGVNGCG